MQHHDEATWAEGLKKIARKVWKNLTPEYLNLLYKSIPRRLQDVAVAEGGHTKY